AGPPAAPGAPEAARPAARPGAPEAARPAERAGAVEPVLRGPLRGHTMSIFAIALSPDGKTLASADFYAGVKLWDAEARREQTTLQGFRGGAAVAVAFSPDGKTLAAGARGATKTGKETTVFRGAVKLWDVTTGKEKTTLWVPSVEVYAVAFSPDGKTLAAAGGVGGVKEHGEVKVWDLATLEERTF